MSFFENNFTVVDLSGTMDSVCAVSFTNVPFFLANVGFSFWPSDRCLTRIIIESVSTWKSDGWNSKFESCSEISMNFPTKLNFTVLGFFPICFSNGDLLSFFLLIPNAYKISDKPDLSFVRIVCLFARSHSLFVLTSRSTLPFPL